MNDKTKSILWKIIWIVFSFLFLEMLVIAIVYLVTLLNTYNVVELLTTDQLINSYKHLLTNIPQTIKDYISERNVIFIIGSIIALVYSLVLNKGKLKKDGWETENRNTYHGSARWATPSEIFDKQNFIKQPKNNVLSEFEQSLKYQSERND